MGLEGGKASYHPIGVADDALWPELDTVFLYSMPTTHQQYLSLTELGSMLECGELSVTVFHRRQKLMAVAELAAKAKGHTPGSRARLKEFQAVLAAEENNDEIEVTGEILCEVVMCAMNARST